MNKKQIYFGSFCGIMTGICWGVSGVFGQFLFETRDVQTAWLVPIRLLSSGILLFIFQFFKNREELLSLPKQKKDFIQTIVAGIFGTMMFQYTFFKAVQTSNAGTATVLQYLCPVFVMVYVCCRSKKLPNRKETLSIILALSGIFLISTHGNLNTLAMTPEALFWGLFCAFSMFTNTVLPESLYKKYSSMTIISWAFIFGGIVLSCLFKPWNYSVKIDIPVIISLFFIIIGGSVAAYLFYANAIKRIGPSKASIFSTSEPIAATTLSAVWLGTTFIPIDLVGFALILSVVFILSLGKQE